MSYLLVSLTLLREDGNNSSSNEKSCNISNVQRNSNGYSTNRNINKKRKKSNGKSSRYSTNRNDVSS